MRLLPLCVWEKQCKILTYEKDFLLSIARRHLHTAWSTVRVQYFSAILSAISDWEAQYRTRCFLRCLFVIFWYLYKRCKVYLSFRYHYYAFVTSVSSTTFRDLKSGTWKNEIEIETERWNHKPQYGSLHRTTSSLGPFLSVSFIAFLYLLSSIFQTNKVKWIVSWYGVLI